MRDRQGSERTKLPRVLGQALPLPCALNQLCWELGDSARFAQILRREAELLIDGGARAHLTATGWTPRHLEADSQPSGGKDLS